MSAVACAVLDALYEAGLRDSDLVAATKRVLSAESVVIQTVRELVQAGAEGEALWTAAESVERAVEEERPVSRQRSRYVAPRTTRYGPYQEPEGYWSEEKQRAYDFAAQFEPGEPQSRLPDAEWWPLVGQVFRRDRHICTYCGAPGGEYSLHCDHIVPITRGGTNSMENLTTACEHCNCSKRDSLPHEWRAIPERGRS